MEKDKLPKTHVEQIGEIKSANENPSIQEERVLSPMDSASTTTKSGESIPEKEIEEKIDRGKESKNKSFAEKEMERRASNSQDKGATRGGRGGGFKIPGQFLNAPDKIDQMINLDPYDDNKPLSMNQEQGDGGYQSLHIENDNIRLALNDLSNQPSIEDNASNTDEISKEDFKAALQDVVFTSADKNDITDLENVSREDFSNALADLNTNSNELANDFGDLDKGSEENQEEVLMAMNDFDNSSDKDEIGSFYWEGEVYEEKLEMGEIDEDGSPSMDMGGGDDD